METMGRTLLVFGGILVGLGLLFMVLGRIPFIGRLPGDIRLELGNMSCYFPLMSGILLSILATIVLNLIVWLLRR
jgi:hypothetical protein